MCQFYRQQYGLLYHSAMPTNLYGPGDNYHAENSHVIPALIRRFHEAKVNVDQEIAMWGTGTPLREFLHCDDLAEACFHLLELENPPDWINVGSGKEISIANLAQMVAKAVGYNGKIFNDLTKPDGCPRKFLDTQLILSSGWRPQISLQEGLKAAYSDFLSSLQDGSARVG
jgi:GDP-L-fucose synthase